MLPFAGLAADIFERNDCCLASLDARHAHQAAHVVTNPAGRPALDEASKSAWSRSCASAGAGRLRHGDWGPPINPSL
jgi:hypothetical protein